MNASPLSSKGIDSQWEFATRRPTPFSVPPLMEVGQSEREEIVPPGFSTLTSLPGPNVGELPPITVFTFTAKTLENTPLTNHASTSANPDLLICPTFIEANYEVLESLLRERRKQIHNKDLRIELDYDNEEVVEFKDALNKDGSRVEREFEGRRPSEQRTKDIGSRGVNLPPLLAVHLGKNENGQPLQSTMTSGYGGHYTLTNLGGNLPPNGTHLLHNAQSFIPSCLQLLSNGNIPVYKGIKREYSNARTPQQIGVVERRNRILIEAARTMLVDAKLPVTFWAEAVNTACYVQNMVLVNKSHNKTPYELFNGRSSAIGFLKPFRCHVTILNTLNNLEKFEEKGDEGYFIGYSMSSKAFRVFNKRTRRVEENLHVEFLENKAIKKGASSNWLFDIDSLTKSMNYVLVDTGTISTNLSGTKDATSQEAKKDVSSLRNIALPNWAYNALLEYSSMETSIPMVSSPVLTAYFTDSQKPSSDTRLISKRVSNQEETPSLDNILSLSNRFEDILGVSTNSDESNGVKADISNMETAITASPTPTLRIHKDHPKSQIIGPLDTPIQTRNKSKEVEEQSFIATIHQKTDPDLL
nr:ribonuclease H-like domain-containing protein [Tanacetum cinerariifolium]